MIWETASLSVTGWRDAFFVYSQEEWNKFVAELETLPRMNKDARIFKRYFFGSASEGSFDKQGRVSVPASLRKAAHLEKDVVLVGVQDAWRSGIKHFGRAQYGQ